MQLLRNLWAAFLAWLSSQFMDEPPSVLPGGSEEDEEEPIYHILPHPVQSLPHNEEFYTWQQPDSGQSAAITKGPEYRDGRRQ